MTSTTTTAIPTLGSEELSGVLIVNTLEAVYRFDMWSSTKAWWELVMNESVKPEQISPDGRYLVYDVKDSGIYLMDLAAGESHILLRHPTTSTAYCLSWSPGGSNIAYQTDDGNYVVDLSGKTRLIGESRPPEPYGPSGSLVGSALAYAEFGCPIWTGDSTVLYQQYLGAWPGHLNFTCSAGIVPICQDITIDADTTTVGTLASYGVTLRSLQQRWFVEKASSNAVLLRDKEQDGLPYLVKSSDLQTLGAKRPSPLPFCETSECQVAHFSPDGTQIAYLVESSPNNFNLTIVGVAAPERRTTIPLGNRAIKDLSWSPKGREIILNEIDTINMLDFETRKERNILAASPSLLIWETVWSRDGDYMAVLAWPNVNAPKAEKEVLCIARVADSAYYLLPSLPEGVEFPEILAWVTPSP